MTLQTNLPAIKRGIFFTLCHGYVGISKKKANGRTDRFQKAGQRAIIDFRTAKCGGQKDGRGTTSDTVSGFPAVHCEL